jgi:hypothetical protein
MKTIAGTGCRALLLSWLLAVGGILPGASGAEPTRSWKLDLDAAPAPTAAVDPLVEPTEARPQPPGSYDPYRPYSSTPSAPVTSFGLRLGTYTFTGELDGLNTGFYSEGVFGWSLSRVFALEASIGYFSASGRDGPVDAEVWGAPFLVGARFKLPAGPIELHAGAATGFYLAKYRESLAGDSSRDDAFLWGGNVSAGANLRVSGGGYLGIELKYTLTDDFSTRSGRADLEGFQVLFVSGIGF